MAGSAAGGNNQSYQILLNNYQNALLNTLPDRCTLLTQLFQDSPVKELQYIFPTLVEHIFGFRSGIDWGLLSLEKDFQVKEFEAVKKFLAPDGPVLKLVFRLMEDFSPKFEFPLACLPVPSQLMLKEGKVPALYANKLQIVNPGSFPSTIQLNAFEYYFFHFVYYIVNPSFKNSLNNVSQQDTLYAHILEDYLSYFLPTDGRAVPLYQAPHNIQHSPILTSSLSSSFGSPHAPLDSSYSKNFSRPDSLSPVRQKPSLIKKGLVMMFASSGYTPGGFGSTQVESWKSETFLLILKEIYLNQNSLEHQQNMLDLSMKTFVPSHYHVWMVRIMVKHLHFFFNTSLRPNSFPGHGQIMIDSLGRLKSLGMTQLIQKEMYSFIKSTFDHWPLDASFRVPLETWLSYIQPWRYYHSDCDLELNVWQKFVTENVLFYTSVFQQVLRRFLRMDFNCPKNAYMLYRVTKVFSIPGVREMIIQAEKGVSKPSSLSMSTYIHRSPEKSFSFRKVSNLESPGANYVPLFSVPVFTMVSHLLTAITEAQQKAHYCDINQNSVSRSFISKVYSFFDTSDDVYNSDDNSPADIKKVSSYLETSIKQLCSFFKEVQAPVLHAIPSMNAETSMYSNNSGLGDDSRIKDLSSYDQHLLMNKKRKLEITYCGNPDLQPVRTYEIAALVSFFNEFAQQLNERYASEIQRFYHQNTFWGKVCRRILAKPVTYYEVIKSKNMMSVTRNPVHLPPRIHLRFLANKQLMIYFFLLLLVSYWYGYTPVFTVILLFIFGALSVSIFAVLYPVPIETKQN